MLNFFPSNPNKYIPMTPRLTFLPEWVEQDLVLLSWPNETMDWASRLPQIEACYKQMVEAILAYEDLLILAKDTEHVRALLSAQEYKHELFIMEMDCNDTWCRDYAPLSLLLTDEDGQERPMIVDFTFNGWGMKFAADKDNLITRALYLSRAFVPETAYTNALSLVFEGGGIESDGAGTLLSTESVIVEPNRNAGVDDEALLSPTAIAYVSCEDPKDDHYHELERMKKELEALRTKDGVPYELIPLPLPPALYDEEGERMPATYANFLFVNGALLVPTYDVATDAIALERLQAAVPDRAIVPVPSRALIYQHGSLHCATMQFPRGFINKNKWR